MHGLLRQQDIVKIVKEALECSVYLAPREPGLTHEELFEIGARLNLERGEIGDLIPAVAAQLYVGDRRLMPRGNGMWSQFHFPEDPDYRNVPAFDFVCTTLKAIARAEGAAGAQIERAVLVARAVAQGLPEREVEAAITIMVLDEHLLDRDGVLRFALGRHNYPLASEQLQQGHGARQFTGRLNETRARVYPLVKDVVERRTDGRPKTSEPLDAFSDVLEKLGYAPFRLWWKQTVAELRHADPRLSPVAVTVFAAALVEGALTFVVRHARGLELGVFGSRSLDGDPRTWKIDDLVSSASAGQASAILDGGARHRADELVRARQRIHAGRMLSEFPGGPTDLRPEEARAAKETADVVVRRVLDWLARFPPS